MRVARGETVLDPEVVGQLLVRRRRDCRLLVGVATRDGNLLWEVGWPGNVAVIPTPIVHNNHVFANVRYLLPTVGIACAGGVAGGVVGGCAVVPCAAAGAATRTMPSAAITRSSAWL